MPTDRADYLKRFQNEQRAHGVRRVSVTLSAFEYEALAKSAARFDESPTTHLKRSALGNLSGEVRLPPELASRMDALLSVVRGIGNNLNQLARHSNEMRAFLDTNEVRLQIKRLDEEVKTFLIDAVRNAPPSR
jgi:Bacterial mobilisation protein (MobC)